MEMGKEKTRTCDECGSLFYRAVSEMEALCPACAHVLYDYEPCEHEFVDGRCAKCYWDGSESVFVKNLKRQG